MLKATILKDSIGKEGSAPRLTTFLLEFPRYILAEFNTHRMFSRNAASSRAIPVSKRLEMVAQDPVIPVEWGLDQPGMQAPKLAEGETLVAAVHIWENACRDAASHARKLADLGISKQIVNRLLEPFVSVQVLMTSTARGLENFFALRADPKPDPAMRALAGLMLWNYNNHTPEPLAPGEWHIPFGDDMYPDLPEEVRLKVAVARAARLSYNNFDGSRSLEKDLALHDQLAKDGHWSSFEHCAQVMPTEGIIVGRTLYRGASHTDLAGNRRGAPPVSLSGNLPGWVQLRKTYPNECRRDDRVVRWAHTDGSLHVFYKGESLHVFYKGESE